MKCYKYLFALELQEIAINLADFRARYDFIRCTIDFFSVYMQMREMSEIEMCISFAKKRYRDESVCKWTAFIALRFVRETVQKRNIRALVLFFAVLSIRFCSF